jgi:flagellar biosynthesis/type III secretory pathway ATPase
METAIIVVLAAFSAVMVYLRATAPKTATAVDDKLLEIGEKVQVIVDAVTPKVTK